VQNAPSRLSKKPLAGWYIAAAIACIFMAFWKRKNIAKMSLHVFPICYGRKKRKKSKILWKLSNQQSEEDI